MKSTHLRSVLSLLLISVTSLAAQPSSIQGADAKRLYLALKGVTEQEAPFYSLRKSSKDVLCRKFYVGFWDILRHECTIQVADGDPIQLVDAISEDNGGQVIRNEGGEELYESLVGVPTVSNGGHPVQEGRHTAVACTLRSPIQAPENESVEKFSCELTPL